MPSVYITLPPSEWYRWPASEPPTLRPPPPTGSLRAPFAIPDDIFDKALDPMVPITIASVYFTTIAFLNRVNRRRQNKPWAVSKTRAFFWVVVAHNVFLALYSLVTHVAMFRALRRTLPPIGQSGDFTSTVDAFCKMHGPRGLGDAVSFDARNSTWGTTNPSVMLDGGMPNQTDVGRLWNEGLAFWGWIFYLSKFYEVVDTLIIIAKGKRSSTLQTYHHAGAMLSMWAGIRYMSPPIWMFVYVNSGIHALMYTYYTVAAFGIYVPQRLKRTLTTMQIMQFVVGTLFAAAHLFLSYSVSIPTPYTFLQNASRVVSSAASEASAAPSASSLASSASSAVVSMASAVPTSSLLGAVGNLVKQVAWRAAGEEGIAENIDTPAQSAGMHNLQNVARSVAGNVHTAAASVQSVVEPNGQTAWRNELKHVSCITTPGQAFAINLNIFYLLPLTYLFGRFFYRSYILPKLTGKPAVQSKKSKRRSSSLLKATQSAAKATRREVENIGKMVEGGHEENAIEDESSTSSDQNGDTAQSTQEAIKEKAMNGVKKVGQRGRKLVKDAVVEGDMEIETNGGLSTSDPHDEGSSYADKAQK